MQRYLIDRDDDGHWYLMPKEDLEAFRAWLADEEGGPEPEGLIFINGPTSNVTFALPEVRGESAGEGVRITEEAIVAFWSGWRQKDQATGFNHAEPGERRRAGLRAALEAMGIPVAADD